MRDDRDVADVLAAGQGADGTARRLLAAGGRALAATSTGEVTVTGGQVSIGTPAIATLRMSSRRAKARMVRHGACSP
ncbi:MAG TPA: hypothetical protein VNT54_00520, partial [Solirubrobacteraceae bacterium]|nr:hypothetical protein [Solirubrobacteraceae bacterium]